jgi:hypothetical protein
VLSTAFRVVTEKNWQSEGRRAWAGDAVGRGSSLQAGLVAACRYFANGAALDKVAAAVALVA